MSEMRFSRRGRYKMPEPYDPDNPEYDHAVPAIDDNGIMYCVDCWIVNSRGKRHPGYDVSPVPVLVSDFTGE